MRQLEPTVAPGVRGAIWAPGDHQVDNRLLVAALLDAAAGRGCGVHRDRRRAPSMLGRRGVRASRLRRRRRRCAPGAVVLAAGCWSGAAGRAARRRGARRATGEGTDPAPAALPSAPRCSTATVRGLVQGSSVYVVPRADGTVVVGATVEERGFDTAVTAGAVYELLRDAHRVVPGITEMVLAEAQRRPAPGLPRQRPHRGPAAVDGVDGLVLATGHYRQGILLAPLTADGRGRHRRRATSRPPRWRRSAPAASSPRGARRPVTEVPCWRRG